MDIISYSDARANLKSVMDRVCADHVPIAITRQGARPVVMIGLDDYNNWQETLRIYRNPAQYRALMESIEQAKRGELIYKTMDELKTLEKDCDNEN